VVADEAEPVPPVDQVIYQSHPPGIAALGMRYGRYGNGRCTVLRIKAGDTGWVLLPHGMPNLAVHLPTDELTTMPDNLREKR
jgi:hypothetical protein